MYSPVHILPIDVFDLKDDHTVANMSVFCFHTGCATVLGKPLLTRSEDLMKQCQAMLSSRGQSKR